MNSVENNPGHQLAASTLMFRETGQAGEAVVRMLERNVAVLGRVAAHIAGACDGAIVTCARGSSDNASTYGRYLFATMLGRVGVSASPSISSLYGRPTCRAGDIFVVVSQSGGSPDLIEATRLARRAGAFTVAIINAEGAPLADEADEVIWLSAGVERSVAATKSFISTQAAFAALAARASGSAGLLRALDTLPARLDVAFEQDWGVALDPLRGHDRMFVLARGAALGTAQEAALKLKEVAGKHAEAISSAEVLHGPIALMREGGLALVFSPDDATRASTEELVRRLVDDGARVLLAGFQAAGTLTLPVVASEAALAPLLMAESFYAMAANLSVALGRDPDQPPGLSKITKTV